jgi:hypothetical protein
MNSFDLWLITNPAQAEQDRNMNNFDLWLDRESDTETLAKYINKDLVLFVSEEGLDWDYPDQIHEKLIENFGEDLFEYYLNSEV